MTIRRHPPGRPPAFHPAASFDAEAAMIAQLRRRLMNLDGGDGHAPPPVPPHVRRRAAELLARLRRVAPAVLVLDAGDADAALMLDGRGLARLRPHDRPGLLLLTLAAAAGRGRA